ncbi:NADH-quinone oxidoreductase subunit NuoK [Carboxydochorda subterranea]|uniref:NADH-quinone oxidoreductase subunit K n=1 Tax=Carboxydichorda subterranea TaxID=3109565 RepID=A0ABZ1C0R3_9FIRM|nr:NADH-quinone oxidoreductase subunit NuoK [Limnochorda sp. L945t]WRP18593.1 NADH-quinone oxidoreductase subunit NuoK [Limnochorda sp. L945t]
MIPLHWVLATSALLFGLGLYGALALHNAVRILMSIELMLNSVNLNLVAFSRYLHPDQPKGLIMAIFIMTVAAAEAAVGLAIFLIIARNRTDVDVDKIHLLKG